MKLELLTNATVVDYAIRFVSVKTKENLISCSGSDDNKESNEDDYDEDQLEKEQQGSKLLATRNAVF